MIGFGPEQRAHDANDHAAPCLGIDPQARVVAEDLEDELRDHLVEGSTERCGPAGDRAAGGGLVVGRMQLERGAEEIGDRGVRGVRLE